MYPIENPEGENSQAAGQQLDRLAAYQGMSVEQKGELPEQQSQQALQNDLQSKLHGAEDILCALTDGLSEAIFIIDKDGRTLLANAAAIETADSFAEGFLSDARHTDNIFLPDTATPFPACEFPAVRALEGFSSTDVAMYAKRPGALSPIWLSVSARPLRAADGRVDGAVIAVRDITTRRRLQEQLQAVADEAVRSAKVKSEFIANVSHEIRTPLAGILGMAELLATREESDAESREIAGYVLQSAQSLLEIVNDLLDFSKLEAGKLTLNKDWFSVSAVLAEVSASIAPTAQKKTLKVSIDCDPRILDNVFGDRGRLLQILLNFGHNATKFTERGQIIISATLQNDTPDMMRVKFAVTDTGIGIKPEVIEKLFQPFVQADGSTTRRYGGTGLGLSIAKQLCQLMSGEIGVFSEPGRGSQFWVSVPLEYKL